MRWTLVFVSCDGKDKKSKEMLEGLKFKLKDNMTAPGFHAKQFPFGHNEETWPQLILDLTNTRFVQQHELEQRLNLQCRAWANNID